jgi:hypothetical protein
MEKYQVLSPDGFDLECGKKYQSRAEAEEGLKAWCKRYEGQGYYSTIQHGERVRIALNELSNYCEIKTI